MEVKKTNGNWALLVALTCALVVVGLTFAGCGRRQPVEYATKEEVAQLRKDVDAIKDVLPKPKAKTPAKKQKQKHAEAEFAWPWQ